MLSGEGQVCSYGGGGYAGKVVQAIENVAIVSLLGMSGRIGRSRQVDPESQQIGRGESQVHIRELKKAPRQQTGADQEHQRHRKLADDEDTPHRPRSAPAALRIAARFERLLHADSRRAERRRNPEHQPGEQRQSDGEC